jgi:hypothetical protein
MPAPPMPGPNQKLPGTDWVRCDHGECVKHDSEKDPLKQHCISKGADPCSPNNPKDEHKCHCRAFKWLPKKKEWEDKGIEDFKDDDDIYCFCVRLPHGN